MLRTYATSGKRHLRVEYPSLAPQYYTPHRIRPVDERLPDEATSSERGLEPDEIAVRVGSEDLPDTGFFFTDPIPLRLRLHEEFNAAGNEGSGHGVRVWDADLKVDPSPKGRFEGAGDPVTADTSLLEHEVSGTECDV
jgi:hypothetical protein